MDIAIIGGTGVYDPEILTNVQENQIDTPFGRVTFTSGVYCDKKIAFIPRHGRDHSVAPHKINYRANIWAIKKLGINTILATTAVGAVTSSLKPGDFVLVDQFLDFTKSRTGTFYEGGNRGVIHVDMTKPYCIRLRELLYKSGNKLTIPIHQKGTYVCTEGPRFETPAEIRMFSQMGGDVVGMTSVPEVVLAREAEICYATISMVTNYAAGISQTPLTHTEVFEAMAQNAENIKKLIMQTIQDIDIAEDCSCKHALAEFGGFKL